MANLFLHYAFDTWMVREFPTVQFELYADDAVLHCVTERQAREVLDALTNRMAEVGLRLHPAKTRIVYCQDGVRQRAFEHTAFTFLGYTFRARLNRSRHGNLFLSFELAVSEEALKKMGWEVRSWHLHTRSELPFHDLARRINPVVAGWINYYGRFRPWEVDPVLMRINAYLVRWICRKNRDSRPSRKPSRRCRRSPSDIPRCSRTGAVPPQPYRSDDQNDKSRMTGDCHVQICESRGVRFPSATRHGSGVRGVRDARAGRGRVSMVKIV